MKTSKVAIGAVFGAAVGVALGILTAPKSGKDTREELKRKAETAKLKADATRDDILFRAEEVADEVRAKTTDTIESVKTSLRK
jgi:gas vesicle protein